jgi:hypothetical protein
MTQDVAVLGAGVAGFVLTSAILQAFLTAPALIAVTEVLPEAVRSGALGMI